MGNTAEIAPKYSSQRCGALSRYPICPTGFKCFFGYLLLGNTSADAGIPIDLLGRAWRGVQYCFMLRLCYNELFLGLYNLIEWLTFGFYVWVVL